MTAHQNTYFLLSDQYTHRTYVSGGGAGTSFHKVCSLTICLLSGGCMWLAWLTGKGCHSHFSTLATVQYSVLEAAS